MIELLFAGCLLTCHISACARKLPKPAVHHSNFEPLQARWRFNISIFMLLVGVGADIPELRHILPRSDFSIFPLRSEKLRKEVLFPLLFLLFQGDLGLVPVHSVLGFPKAI